MTDIVERLRKRADGRTTGTHFNLLLDAAEAVERLRSELASARAAAFEEAAQLALAQFDEAEEDEQPGSAEWGLRTAWNGAVQIISEALRARAQEGR